MLPAAALRFQTATQSVYASSLLSIAVLLLVIMMVVTPYTVVHTHNVIPTAVTALPETVRHPMLGIDYRGTHWLHADGDWERLLPNEMPDAFMRLFAARADRVLFVSADVARPYGDILGVLEAAQAANVSRISLLVECPRGTETLRARCRA
jgi:biopolymer transport protein ExbD